MNMIVNVVGEVPDIPKLYTAFAEWSFCALYALVYLRRLPDFTEWTVLTMALAALSVVQLIIGKVSVELWLPGMGVAVGIMFLILRRYCSTRMTAAWLLAKAFLLAEFTASLEWQLYFYASRSFGSSTSIWIQITFAIMVYSAVFIFALMLEWHQDVTRLDISFKELGTPAVVVAVTFALSNLSYVSSTTPFSSRVGTEVFNIRTLVDAGGIAFLYAYQNQLFESRTKNELDSIRRILQMQYMQYQQSRESIEVVNHKYHDLKHQLAVLRSANSATQREEYLNDIERGIREYEIQFRTGNAVLDTILTSKGLNCANRGIELTCVIDGSLLDAVTDLDICTIFGNSLDNAIECVEKIEETKKRLIHVSVSKFNDFVLIRVENYIEITQTPDFRDGLPVTTKSDSTYHGFGLKSIRHIANRYAGSVTVQITENWFELTVMLNV